MKKPFLLIVLLVGLFTCRVEAQTLSLAEKRMLYMDILDAVNSYEEYTSISDNTTQRRFVGLFDDSQMPIYNDLLGISGAETLTVKEYAELMLSEAVAPSVHIKNIVHGEPQAQGSQWLLDVRLEKSLEYTNNCDVLFSSKNHYAADYHLTLTYLWDPQTRSCKIHALQGYIETDASSLPDDYVIFTHSDERDDALLFDGKKISFNYFQQTFLSGTFDEVKPKFSYPKDDDMRCILVYEDGKEECGMVKMTYTPKHWRVRPHLDFSMGNSLSSDTYSDWNVDKSSSSFDMGVDLGYMFPSGKNVRTGFFFGLAFSKGKLQVKKDNFEYNYNAKGDADVDADDYVRYYTLSDLKYKVSMMDVYVPLYLDMSLSITSRVSAYMDFGAKAYVNLNNSVSDFSTHYSTYGLFPQYDNLKLYGDSFDKLPADDPKHFTIDGFVTDGKLGMSDMPNKTVPYTGLLSVDAFGALGCRVKVMTDLFMEMGFSYQRNVLSDVLGTSPKLTDVKNSSDYPVTYTVAGGEQVFSPAIYFSKMYRSVAKFNMGVIYRF